MDIWKVKVGVRRVTVRTALKPLSRHCQQPICKVTYNGSVLVGIEILMITLRGSEECSIFGKTWQIRKLWGSSAVNSLLKMWCYLGTYIGLIIWSFLTKYAHFLNVDYILLRASRGVGAQTSKYQYYANYSTWKFKLENPIHLVLKLTYTLFNDETTFIWAKIWIEVFWAWPHC